jgi:hypothetical protein
MATRSTAQFQNRPTSLGGGNGSGGKRVLVDDGASGEAKWLLYGMLFFAIVAFMTLPISVVILMDAKKTNANAQAALAETKKIQREIKPVKKEDSDE